MTFFADIEHDLMPHPRLTHGSKWAQSRGRSGEYLSNRNALAWQFKAKMQGKAIAESCEVYAIIHVAHNRHADIDNYLKTIFDALQAAGIVENDHLIDFVQARVIRGAAKGRVYVICRSIADAEKAVGKIKT